MTADPPRKLRSGEHFDLARDVSYAIDSQIAPDHRGSLLERFGFDSAMHGSRLDTLLGGAEEELIELAEYLGVSVPARAVENTIDPSAATVDAYAELVSAETALRDVIRTAVPNWIADFDADAVKKLEDKRVEEDTRRDRIAVSRDLLDYTEIHQLQQIINKHWDPDVKAILDDKKRTDVYLGIIFDVRNSKDTLAPCTPPDGTY